MQFIHIRAGLHTLLRRVKGGLEWLQEHMVVLLRWLLYLMVQVARLYILGFGMLMMGSLPGNSLNYLNRIDDANSASPNDIDDIPGDAAYRKEDIFLHLNSVIYVSEISCLKAIHPHHRKDLT